jgi:hypothetical protein
MDTGRYEQIKPIASLQEFFKNSVADAMERQGLSADDHTSYYVVNLLTLFARSESFFDSTENGLELKPVARILADSIHSDRSDERNFALQRVGDVSLFVAGFLGDGLARKLVDVDYYVFMGGTAYGTLSQNVRGSKRGNVLSGIFAELAEKFQDFVDVLGDIREYSKGTQTDILRLYETWLKTGSRRAARALRALGIEPSHVEGDGTTRH